MVQQPVIVQQVPVVQQYLVNQGPVYSGPGIMTPRFLLTIRRALSAPIRMSAAIAGAARLSPRRLARPALSATHPYHRPISRL